MLAWLGNMKAALLLTIVFAAGCLLGAAPARPDHVRKGFYHVADGQLSYLDPETGLSEALPHGGDWSGTSSMQTLKKQLFIVQDGKLQRVDPRTGEWFPDGGWSGWHGTLTVFKGSLYGILHGQLVRVIDVDKRKQEPVLGATFTDSNARITAID